MCQAYVHVSGDVSEKMSVMSGISVFVPLLQHFILIFFRPATIKAVKLYYWFEQFLVLWLTIDDSLTQVLLYQHDSFPICSDELTQSTATVIICELTCCDMCMYNTLLMFTCDL